MSYSRAIIGLCALSVSASSIAQTTGSLVYGPAPAAPLAAPTAVPIPSLILLPLGIAMAFFGYRAIRKHGGRKLLGAVLLISGLGITAASSLHIPNAIAAMVIELNNPEGGTVDIPEANATYTNTSGGALRIGAVVAPPACATTAPADECITDLELADGESCSTVYACTQAITFGAAPTVAVGGTATVSATSTSGLAVAFSSTTEAVCTVAGDTVTGVTEGSCVISGNQAGDGNFDAAPEVTQIFSVSKADQTITFVGGGGALTLGRSATVSATSTSGLAVAFTSTTESVCTVSGSWVTSIAAGTCRIKATVAGNSDYLPAEQTLTISVLKKYQAIDQFFVVGVFSDEVSVTARTTATGADVSDIVFTVSSGGCTIDEQRELSGGYYSATIGTPTFYYRCVIAANQTESASYAAARQTTLVIER